MNIPQPHVTIFVVDDDVSVRRGLARLLKYLGYKVEVYASARDFLDKAHWTRADCLLLDIRMPGQTGFDLQELLTKAECSPSIIFISGHGDPTVGRRGIRSGAVEFLSKPFDQSQLLAAIEKALMPPLRSV